jgi:hypothetical protein
MIARSHTRCGIQGRVNRSVNSSAVIP